MGGGKVILLPPLKLPDLPLLPTGYSMLIFGVAALGRGEG